MNFKHLTLINGGSVFVNLDNILMITPTEDGSILYFQHPLQYQNSTIQSLKVKQSPGVIL